MSRAHCASPPSPFSPCIRTGLLAQKRQPVCHTTAPPLMQWELRGQAKGRRWGGARQNSPAWQRREITS